MTYQHAWELGTKWAHDNKACTREQYEARVSAFTNAWGPTMGYRFRTAVLCMLRQIRKD